MDKNIRSTSGKILPLSKNLIQGAFIMLDKKTNSIKKQPKNKKRITTPKRKKRKYNPYMVAGGDSEGKVTYTYPTGNSEDY